MQRAILRNRGLFTALFLLGAPCLYKVDDPLQLKVNSMNESLLQKVIHRSPEIKNMVFRPSYLLSSGHLNSIHTGLSSRYNNYMSLTIKNRTETFQLSDGGEIALQFSEYVNENEPNTTLESAMNQDSAVKTTQKQ